jgi:DNA-binding transcriptional ArsR family regulator
VPAKEDFVSKYFRALGDPTRLHILELLRAETELSVGELAARLEIAQPSVSNHLACLRWCGFVATRREHRVIRNRIADERVTAIVDLAHALLEENMSRLAARSLQIVKGLDGRA